jgi:tRNA modification GTPase
MDSPQDTIAAIATPLGEGGLGVIRVSGSAAIAAVDTFFKSPKGISLQNVASHTCHLGLLQATALVDQAVVTVFRAPHSYTGEDVVEISAHGSPFVLQKILSVCLRQGARLAGPGEFTQRAFLNGKLDLTQAEAVAELIRAKSDKTQAAAIAQLQGHLSKEVRRLRDALLPLLAHVEVGLDHSDEDHDFLARQTLTRQCSDLRLQIETILQSARVGKVLREGLHVVLMGRPNVGKSSLMNALLKEDRAIVTPIAGTTRDTLEEGVNWDGIPVILTDTAGLRGYAQDPIERLGIERTHQALERADLLLGLFDASQPLSPEDHDVIQTCTAKPHVWVMNKTDLSPCWQAEELARLNGGGPIIAVSAKEGNGLQSLVEEVKKAALQETAYAAGAQWLLNARHREALERARAGLERAASASQEAAFEECVALELQSTLQALGEVIGETVTEDLLDQIFSQFCVGK